MINITLKDNSKIEIEEGSTILQVAKKISEKGSKVPLQNLSNKLAKGTIKYSEVKDIAEAIGYEIIWKKK